MRIDAAIKHGTEVLSEISSSARLDTEILLAHSLGKQRNYLYTWPEKSLSFQETSSFNAVLLKRSGDYPIAYIIGYQEFWSLKLKVTPDVLIPRADTELLVETALEKIFDIKRPKILELGTGSGAIALALATERPDSEITATDFSGAAIKVAEENCQIHQIENIQFLNSNWFSNIPAEKYDLIVSNPPYIAATDTHLQESIRYEPLGALVSEDNGLQDLMDITNDSPNYLHAEGWLILEHGYDQGEAVINLLKKAAYRQISCLKDLSGNDRINIALKPN